MDAQLGVLFRMVCDYARFNQKYRLEDIQLELSLQITPVGDTTAREISAASQEVRDVLERLAGVERIEPQRVPAPDQTKGGLVDLLGGLALSVAPAVLRAVLQALQTVLARQPAGTKVSIKTENGEFSFEFNPKKISLGELVDAAERLRTPPPPA
jgi:hypothetical protein